MKREAETTEMLKSLASSEVVYVLASFRLILAYNHDYYCYLRITTVILRHVSVFRLQTVE